ncbi:hypothetical protein [Streptosporangium sp. 'caverna']|uniref:hypothetical protein n=1 Tax=Streptosporangium sp. 'caverna' TaxID=2202249 RepID=UPI0013A703C6|nr:hypothetical protein [Streptosporangium sp. 'caverna']
MSKHTPWDQDAKARIMSTVSRNPNSPSAQDDLGRKAQSGADKNKHEQQNQDDEDEDA